MNEDTALLVDSRDPGIVYGESGWSEYDLTTLAINHALGVGVRIELYIPRCVIMFLSLSARTDVVAFTECSNPQTTVEHLSTWR